MSHKETEKYLEYIKEVADETTDKHLIEYLNPKLKGTKKLNRYKDIRLKQFKTNLELSKGE